jgi:hypothetical protein
MCSGTEGQVARAVRAAVLRTVETFGPSTPQPRRRCRTSRSSHCCVNQRSWRTARPGTPNLACVVTAMSVVDTDAPPDAHSL